MESREESQWFLGNSTRMIPALVYFIIHVKGGVAPSQTMPYFRELLHWVEDPKTLLLDAHFP